MCTPSSPDRGDVAETWSAAQVAAVASAEAIAAVAAAEVASEAADAARAAVDVARAVAARAAARASDVAARAVSAVAAAAAESVSAIPVASRSGEDVPPVAADDVEVINTRAAAAAGAADKVALCVAAVATAAAEAVVEATALVGEQLAADVAATAAAVSVAAAITRPLPAEGPQSTERLEGAAQVEETAPTATMVRGRLGVAEELRLGIAANELRLHYQPIIDLATGRPVGVEALVRWQHPVRGLLAPDVFMDLAERTDVVLPLGTWVLHEACRFAVSQQTWGGEVLTVAVNLSGRQLSDPGLVATVRECLEAELCAAGRLVFEVTETALVTDMGVAVASLRALQALGAGVSIDDFGTGYCSLLYLKHLSANDLKIDRSFVSGLGADSHSTAIVASLISLAHNLDLRCIAEGVETTTQLELLTQLGCDLAQGYLFCPPSAVPALQAWLDGQPTTGVQHPRLGARNPEAPRILAMHNNSISVHSIAAALNAEGKRTPGGLRWSAQSVAKILARRRS